MCASPFHSLKITSRFAITNVSLNYLSKIIKEFEDFPYKGYVSKRYTHMPTVSYFYIARQLENFMMRFNLRIGLVRTQMTNTQQQN